MSASPSLLALFEALLAFPRHAQYTYTTIFADDLPDAELATRLFASAHGLEVTEEPSPAGGRTMRLKRDVHFTLALLMWGPPKTEALDEVRP